MSPLRDDQAATRAARQRVRVQEDALARSVNRARALVVELGAAVRRGDAARSELERLDGALREAEAEVATARTGVTEAHSALGDALRRSAELADPRRLVDELDDRVPILLLPVRVEVRFMTGDDVEELWVRIFPDDVAVHTHENELTADEVASGTDYWNEVWAADQDPDQSAARRLGAWRALAGKHGGPRSAWIASRTEPATLDVLSADELEFPEFGPEDLKAESWSRAPRSYVMPDRFVVLAFPADGAPLDAVGQPIPDPLILGPDPLADEPDLQQVEGDLEVGSDVSWIYDFEEAVRIGMGVKIPTGGADRFDRIVVLGLKLSADPEETIEIVGELFDNHHHAAEGLSLIRQGGATNNSDGARSLFSSVDPAAEVSFVTEAGELLFAPTEIRNERSDGQRLAEALGIDVRHMQHLEHADGLDYNEAAAMNAVLWPATLGYYLEEMLNVETGIVGAAREFMTHWVTGRGPLPAIRVGTQPYGILPTSAMPQWRPSREVDGPIFGFLERLHNVLTRIDLQWAQLVPQVARIGAPGDPFQNLLSILGLHATSVEWHRRHAAGREYSWNYHAFAHPGRAAATIHRSAESTAQQIAAGLGVEMEPLPEIFDLAFFRSQDAITDPFVDDVGSADDERWSESDLLAALYQVGEGPDTENYVGWLLASDFDTIKTQRFVSIDGETLPAPRTLLYRMLRRALLLAYHDATARLYISQGAADARIAREVELPNVRSERSVTRWELMEAPVNAILTESPADLSVVEFFGLPEGLARPEATDLAEVRAGLSVLRDLPTARLERLFAEHLDLCSYRLDAWQTALVAHRLERLREPSSDERQGSAGGLHLGAFGWLENVQRRGEQAVVDPDEIPPALNAAGVGPIVEQPGNGGHIHGPSLNHAVAAAVLRNAYLTHADPEHPDRFAVNLSSERVRRALGLLEGVRNGQELGALLGYEFERGLHDRHGLPGGQALDQFILAFRTKYPLVADKITEDPDGDQIESKEARNVFDGYALAEAILVQEPPLGYPYDVPGLPDATGPAGRAIAAEVERMVASLDAVADLGLAEGVFQVAQGNYDRGGAMLRALTQGTNPPDPEIVRTPRSGATVNHRVVVHVDPEVSPGVWPGDPTPRARIEPGLNAFLGDIIGPPEAIRFILEFSSGDGSPDVDRSLADLGIQPLDLIFQTGDAVHVATEEASGTRDDTTSLEARIAYAYRRLKRDEGDVSGIGDLTIRFIVPDHPVDWGDGAKTVFEVMPLLRSLRTLVTGSRPLGAVDYRLPSESTTDPAVDPNPDGYDVLELEARLDAALQRFADELAGLEDALDEVRATPGSPVALESLRARLVALADHGVPGAFPRDAVGTSPEAAHLLVEQGESVALIARSRRDRAVMLKGLADLSPEEQADLTVAQRIDRYREAAREILGASFNLMPRFAVTNPDELEAAAEFRDRELTDGLTRFSNDPLIVETWLHGVAPVRERVGTLEAARLLGVVLGGAEIGLEPLQLPFRPGDHWVAVEFPPAPSDNAPDGLRPDGEYVSMVQAVPDSGFTPRTEQAGIVVDEWNEVIPGRVETTGIAINYDQPSSEPPQTLLLAVTPELTGSWKWDDLVDTIVDTFDRAKKRAVEPDQVGATSYGQLLPAILTAVSSHEFATVSTDLVAATDLAHRDGSPGG